MPSMFLLQSQRGSIIASVDPRISVPNGALIIIAGIVRVAVISHGSQADAGHERPTRAPSPSGPPRSVSIAYSTAVNSAAIAAPKVSTAIEPATVETTTIAADGRGPIEAAAIAGPDHPTAIEAAAIAGPDHPTAIEAAAVS